MTRPQPPWAPPLEVSVGAAGHLLASEKNEADGTWCARVSWVQETGRRRTHKVVQACAASLHPLEPPEASQRVPRRVRGLDGQIRDGS
jgi:hypothetical protein